MNRDELTGSLIVERYLPVNHGDPFTWWSPAEQAQHRALLNAELDVPMNVAKLVARQRDQLVDWVAVERVCFGEYLPLNRAEKVEAVRYMRGRHFEYRLIMARLHVSGTTMQSLIKAAA